MVCKSSLFLSWLLHKNIKGKMHIYVTTRVIPVFRWHIVLRPHLIALNLKLNDLFNKILCCKKSSIPVHSWLPLRLDPIMITLIAGWYQQEHYWAHGSLLLSGNHHFATMTWLTVMEYLCHKLPRISSTCRMHFSVISSFTTYYRVCD
jgi:hypothetical protein